MTYLSERRISSAKDPLPPSTDVESNQQNPPLAENRTEESTPLLSPPHRPPRHLRLTIGSWHAPELPLRPELIAISLVYLVQGLLGLSRLAVFTYFKDDLQLDPATVGLLTGIGAAPWFVKPVYGFLTDAVPLYGYRRRSYLVLCGVVGASAWSSMGITMPTAAGAVSLLVLGSLSTACADVVADSIVVEMSRGEPQSTAGALQSMCWASAAIGGVLSSYFSGSFVQQYGPQPVFFMTAIFPVMVAGAAALIPEEKVDAGEKVLGTSPVVPSSLSLLASQHDGDAQSAKTTTLPGAAGAPRENNGTYAAGSINNNNDNNNSSSKSSHTTRLFDAKVRSALRLQWNALWTALSQKSIFYPALFVFIWQATPSVDTAMLFFETNQLGFTTEFLGRIRLVASIASLVGVGVYNFYLKKTPLRKMFLWTAVIGTGLGMTQLVLITGLNRQWGLSDELFALGDSALLTVLGQVSFMPVLVLAARLCPEGVEATLFATLMSILNGGSFVGSALGSGLTSVFGVTTTEFKDLAPLVMLCTLSMLLPLPLLRLLPEQVDEEQKEKE